MRYFYLLPALGWVIIAYHFWELLWATEPLYAALAILASLNLAVHYLGLALGFRERATP